MSEDSSFKHPDNILVYITPDPECIRAIDAAARRAKFTDSQISALYVESPYTSDYSQEQMRSLRSNLAHAKEAGLNVETLVGTDPQYLISEYCQVNRISMLYLTRSIRRRWTDRFRRSISRELLETLPEVAIFMVPGTPFDNKHNLKLEKEGRQDIVVNIFTVLITLICAVLLAFLFDVNDADDAVLAPIFILGVLIVAARTTRWYWPVVAAVLSIALFDFFFARPRLSFAFFRPSLLLVFITTFIISIIAGMIAQRMHRQSLLARQSSWRTQILLDTSHLMEETREPQAVIPALSKKLAEVSAMDVVFFPQAQGMLLDPQIFRSPQARQATSFDEVRRWAGTAEFVRQTGQPAGHSTADFSDCPFYFIPWKTKKQIYGVTGVRAGERPLDSLEKMIMNSVVAEGSFTLEARKKEQENLAMREEVAGERQRSNILKAVSHDLRTPLTSIIGNVANLKEEFEHQTAEETHAACDELQNNCMTLLNMVENLLTAARLNNSKISLRKSPESLEDVIEAGLQQPRKVSNGREIHTTMPDDVLISMMDSALIAQVVSNIVLNALHHTQEQTPIEVTLFKKGSDAIVEVCDTGQGISDEMKPRIFDLFYTGNTKIVDSNHFLGLGLYLCKAIISAHQGTIYVRDNEPHGAVFGFTLPLMELSLS